MRYALVREPTRAYQRVFYAHPGTDEPLAVATEHRQYREWLNGHFQDYVAQKDQKLEEESIFTLQTIRYSHWYISQKHNITHLHVVEVELDFRLHLWGLFEQANARNSIEKG